MVESLLGLRLEVDKLHMAPCLPPDWQAFTVHYRHRETVYHIRATRSASDRVMKVTLDGIEQCDPVIPLADDHREHDVEVRIARDTKASADDPEPALALPRIEGEGRSC